MPSLPSPRGKTRPRLEIIPFIDIMFFLLATFMMVSLSMIQNRGIPVRLPAAASAKPQEKRSFTTVTVDEAGDLYLNKEKVGLDVLSARLSAIQRGDPDPQIFIHADERAPFGSVARVLDEVRLLRIAKVAIQTRNLQGSPGAGGADAGRD